MPHFNCLSCPTFLIFHQVIVLMFHSVKVRDLHKPNRSSIHINCAIYVSHTHTHTHPYSLYTEPQAQKIQISLHHTLQHHSQTKYQHTKQHNVYGHSNTIQKMDNRNSNTTVTTFIGQSITIAWHIFSSWTQMASIYWVAVNILNNKLWAGNKQRPSSLAVRWAANTPYHKNVTC